MPVLQTFFLSQGTPGPAKECQPGFKVGLVTWHWRQLPITHQTCRESGFGDITYAMFSPSAIMMVTGQDFHRWWRKHVWVLGILRSASFFLVTKKKIMGLASRENREQNSCSMLQVKHQGYDQIHPRQALFCLFWVCHPLCLGGF